MPILSLVRKHSWVLVLLFAPAAVILHAVAPDRHTTVFLLSTLAIIPLAGYIGHATEQLSERLGGGIGGLMNATFGNATELIIGAFALHEGLYPLVKASITGSILGNILLVFGLSALVGGLGRETQRFNRTAASMGTTMLVLSAIGLIVPGVFHHLAQRLPESPDLQLDTEIAVVLFITYCLSLLFTLKTHRRHYGIDEGEGVGDNPAPHAAHAVPLWKPTTLLVAATVGDAIVSETLVGAVAGAAESLGMSQFFVGIVIVALIGNAAEHYSAVVLAARDQMDAAISIAIGSSNQIALLVAPLLVFLSYLIGPHPMDLVFSTFELMAVAVSVLSIAFISHDGESNWMEGVQLLAVYAILALAFFFLPVH
jgi:Ca2+:H+ antiporter